MTATDATQPASPSASYRWFVRIAIYSTFLLAFGMFTLIYLRWASVDEPTSEVRVHGDSAAHGVKVSISPIGRTTSPATGMLMPDNDYTLRVNLQSGHYEMHATREDANAIVYNFSLEDRRVLSIDLTKKFPATAPASPK